MKRIALYFAVNLLVVISISIIINLLGVKPYLTARGIDYQALLIFCAIWGFAGSFISLQLSRWSAKMAMGVQLIDPKNPGGTHEARIVETVTRICQHAGLSTLPEIGIYPSPEVNAFATGPSQSRSLLAISSGLLNAMDDSAVEGVLGHEIAHIANGDMVTMTLIQGVVNTFVMFFSRIAVFAIENMMRSDKEERGGGLGFFAHMILISVFETLFMFLSAPLIYYFSRHREFRADKGSARFTSPQTMIHALESLKKCADLVDNRQASLAALKINGHTRGILSLLFSSHPPIEARIAALRQ